MNALVPFLSGWLAGAVMREGRGAMKVVAVRPSLLNAFEVEFASGLVLLVSVGALYEPPARPEGEGQPG